MIKQLDALTVNKIAAGEVVERPFSVVKELVENSIDAGSKKIIVEIKDGGVSFIRVTDNGAGIPAAEIETAFKSHATSKISAASDLISIKTLGFRGEALASIAAVSQLDITSKTSDQAFGACLEIFGGEIIKSKEIACNTGTVIVTRNLFYNTPARRKFLKSTSAETGYISDFINKIALSKPDISFRFINNGNEIVFTSGGGDLKTAIFCVYGMEYAEALIKTEYEHNGIVVGGFIGKPEMSRSNRMFEDVFVNGRYVKDKTIFKAAEDAYKTYLTINRFPVFVLNVSLNPEGVDVNAHPQKLEVRFANEEDVYNAVYGAVASALKSASLVREAIFELPSASVISAKEERKLIHSEKPDSEYVYSNASPAKIFSAKECDVVVIDRPVDINKAFSFEKTIIDTFKNEKSEQQSFLSNKPFSDYRIIGQVFSTYWLIEEGAKLYIIDQHAAHERIQFEAVKKRITGGDIVSQVLVAPERLTLSEREKGVLIENFDFIESIGFGIEEIDGEMYLKHMPMFLYTPENSKTVKTLIDMLCDGYSDSNINIHELKLNVLASIACKASVKANDRISAEEANAIIKSLVSIENPFTCPHGRPTVTEITKYRFEQLFKRA